jgi:hypothetical protein
VRAVDAANLAWLWQIVKAQGFPTAQQVGETGMHLAWILIQHSDEDPEFRASLVPTLIERFNAGDMSPDDIARVIEPISAQSLLDSAILDPARHRHSGMTSSLECLLQCFRIGDRFGAHIVQGKPFRKHARKPSEV